MSRSNCPIGCALDEIGDRWTLLIIRDALYKGFTTYNDFLGSPEKIATNILSDRQKLTELGFFEKKADPANKLKSHYQLTKKGKDLESVVIAIGKWGHKHLDGTIDMMTKINN